MGADARWICHTCKTVCYRGGKPLLQSTRKAMTVEEVGTLLVKVSDLHSELKLSDAETTVSFLNDLKLWLERHEEHDIHIGSDYSTDMMELDDHYEEAVDGKRSVVTLLEACMQSVSAMEETAVREIEDVINTWLLKKGSTRDIAVELFKRFSY